LALHPLLYLQAYYDQAVRWGRTNTHLFQTIDTIKANRGAEEPVVVDQALELMRLGWGSGRVGSGLRTGLAVADIPSREVDLKRDELLAPNARCQDQFLILDLRVPDTSQEVLARLDLRDLAHRPATPPAQAGTYRLYRLDRPPDAPRSCWAGSGSPDRPCPHPGRCQTRQVLAA